MSTQQIEMKSAIPEDLKDKGWRLFFRESTSPFIAEHDEWELSTGGYPDVEAACSKARELTAEEEERQAIAGDGAVEAAEAAPEKTVLELTEGEHLLGVDDIRTDGGTQPRSELNMHTVADYAEAMREGVKFPAVDVFFDGENVWLGDGFHRHAATKEAELEEIVANVRLGTQRDALLYSLGANATHGLKRSNEDKRRAVRTMLEDKEWSTFSDNVIAQKCNVSQPFVSSLRHSLTTQNVISDQPVRTGLDGVTRDTANIGKESEPDERQASLADLEGVELPDRTPVADPPEDEFAPSSSATTVDETDENEPTDGDVKEWTTQDVVDALTRHNGVLFRMQLEEMGISFNAIHKALEEEAIIQPETGKFALPGYKAPNGEAKSSASSPAPKPKPSVEEILKGRQLSVSFTWIPALKGKVNVSVNMGNNPTDAVRKLLVSEVVPRFPEEVLSMIHDQLKEYNSKSKSSVKVTKAAKKAPAKKPVAKKAASKKAAKKKAPARRKK